MPLAQHINTDGKHCCPHCLESDDYDGQGADRNGETVECTACGEPFLIWTEVRFHQCSCLSDDD